MNRTLVAVFDDVKEAEQTIQELEEAGFPRTDIGVVAHRTKCGPAVGPLDNIGGGTTAGTGAAVGGIAGFVAGVVALVIPGIGPVLAVGPLAAGLMGAGIGSATGAIIGKLKDMGVPAGEAECYCEAVRRGGIVVSVQTPEEMAAQAEEIIDRRRLVDIEDCAVTWRQQGWRGFETQAETSNETAPEGLPFDPSTLGVRGIEKRKRRAVKQYVRVR